MARTFGPWCKVAAAALAGSALLPGSALLGGDASLLSGALTPRG
jgi:hypothetical protein